MSDIEKSAGSDKRPPDFGVFDRPGVATITPVELVAIALSVVWVLSATAFFVFSSGEDGGNAAPVDLQTMMIVLSVFMPLAMIWVIATAVKTSRILRQETGRLQASVDALRQAYIAQQQGLNQHAETSVSRKLEEIAAATRKTEAALAMFQSKRDLSTPRQPEVDNSPVDDQPALALGTPAEALSPALSNDDFIRALNFPETPEDKAGFAALRRALQDRSAAQLVQAAQDMLTLMSQDGIYMDDLHPDRAQADLWRRFAKGDRGPAVASIGGIRDRSSLALTNARMKQDAIFRDSAHHFLRHFDKTFVQFEKDATDAEIIAVADTRTARAFMLLGRCAGTFD
jgi:hypothetical protein